MYVNNPFALGIVLGVIGTIVVEIVALVLYVAKRSDDK